MLDGNRNIRNKLWKKEDNKTGFDMWVTHREYCSAYAAKHGVIALQVHGWGIRVHPTPGNFIVVAMKKAEKVPSCPTGKW